MGETISQDRRKARKKHICDYCGGAIQPGEIYHDDTLKYDGMIYHWKSHERCSLIASEIWDYVDPDDGMSEDDFCDGCHDICRTFVCPDCPEFDRECGECEKDETYCTERMADFFQKYELVRDRKSGNPYIWKCQKRQEAEG